MYVWACGVVVSMYDFQRSDQSSNPGRCGEMFIIITTTLYCGTSGKCLKTICHGFHPSHVREIEMGTIRKPVGG